jgi:hypothetical protein
MVALAIGGNGTLAAPAVIKSAPSADFLVRFVEALIYNSRLLGLFDSSVATGTWQAVFAETPRAVRLPIETFGYQYAIGGYHAVLAGFLLQFLALTIWRPSGARLRPSAPGSNSSLVSRYRMRFARMPGSFPSRRRWSVPGRCGTGAAQAPGTCATSRPGPVPGAAPASLSRRDQQRDRLHASGAGCDAAQSSVPDRMVALLVLAFAVPLAGQAYPSPDSDPLFSRFSSSSNFQRAGRPLRDDFIRFNPSLKWSGWIFTGGVFSISAAACR